MVPGVPLAPVSSTISNLFDFFFKLFLFFWTLLSTIQRMDIEMPTKHLNGGDWARLGTEYYEALIKLEVLSDKLANVQFHPRDYYVKDGSFERAKEQREKIFGLIREIKKYLEKHCEHIFSA